MSVNVYRFTMTALCPVDGSTDEYRAEYHTDTLVPVETILETAKRWENKLIFQEDLTAELRAALWTPFGGSVTLVGVHSGVEVTSSCT